jgi:cobalt-zinc-cadmium efflux system protein
MRSQSSRLLAVLVLNLIMIAGLIVVGLKSHSLGVLAAGGDYVADSMAIGLGLLAIYLKGGKYAYPKATSIVALINSTALLIITATVVVNSLQRLISGTPAIDGLPVLVISLVATAFMLAGAKILGDEAEKEDLHMRSVLLDTLSDAASSAAIAVTGTIILLTGRFYWLDSAAALLLGVIIGFNALKLMRDVIRALRKDDNYSRKAA